MIVRFIVFISLLFAGIPADAQNVVDRPPIADDSDPFLSEVRLSATVFTCVKTIAVEGHVPGARIVVAREGADGSNPDDILGTVEDAERRGVRIVVPLDVATVDGQILELWQEYEGERSQNFQVRVRNHKEVYHDRLPKPSLWGTPPLQCGRAIGVEDVVAGATITLFAVDPSSEPRDPRVLGQTENFPYVISSEPFQEAEELWVETRMCEDQERSDSMTVRTGPGTLSGPFVDPVPSGSSVAVVRGAGMSPLVQGANLEVIELLGANEERVGGQPTPGYHAQQVFITQRASDNKYHATQELCEGSIGVGPEVDTIACGDQDAPRLANSLEPGDASVVLASFHPGSRIRIFSDDEELGDGSGPTVALRRPLEAGDSVHVVQDFEGCEAGRALRVSIRAPEPPPPPPEAGEALWKVRCVCQDATAWAVVDIRTCAVDPGEGPHQSGLALQCTLLSQKVMGLTGLRTQCSMQSGSEMLLERDGCPVTEGASAGYSEIICIGRACE